MAVPQNGIFALGTSSHAYLEFDLRPAAEEAALVAMVASLREPRTTIGGVNLVCGFRPELWRSVVPGEAPTHAEGFNHDVAGIDGYVMPATQHDIVLWISGSSYDVVFDTSRDVIAALLPLASVADETVGWPYHHDRDLTGFEDGTENPTVVEATDVALIPEGDRGAGGSILLLQKWPHDAAVWESMSVEDQERAMGRTKLGSIELEDKATDSHVERTDQDSFGKIFRRNLPYGTATDHGTMFVGFSAEQGRLAQMLESMAGLTEGVRDALTFMSRPLTGAYYVIPSTDALRRLGGDES